MHQNWCWDCLATGSMVGLSKHHPILCLLTHQQKDSGELKALTHTAETQVLSVLHRSAWRRPQTQCSSGLFLPQQREPRGSHRRSGYVRRPSQLPSWLSRPRPSLKTLSLHCWQTHYSATCGSQNCVSPLRAGKRRGSEIDVGTEILYVCNSLLKSTRRYYKRFGLS